ncbi:MAG: hypothetical protein QM713_06615 [Arachnia sp.]
MRSLRVTPRAVLTIILAGCLCWIAGTAIATNFGSQGSVGTIGTTNGVFLLPSKTMSVKRVNLTSTNSAAVSSRVASVYNPTDLVATTLANNEACNSYEVICVFDANYGDNNLYGWNACNSGASGSHPNMKCGQQWVRLNTAYTPPSASILACHELAHTVGLRHVTSGSTCVIQYISSSTPNTLSAHDIAHINAQY